VLTQTTASVSGRDRRGGGAVAEQGELADEVAGAELGDRSACARHAEGALLQQDELAVAGAFGTSTRPAGTRTGVMRVSSCARTVSEASASRGELGEAGSGCGASWRSS
jgi:hypothetical protein